MRFEDELNKDLADVYHSRDSERTKKMEFAEPSSISTLDDILCIICLESSDIRLIKCEHRYCIRCIRGLFNVRIKKLQHIVSIYDFLCRTLESASLMILKCFCIHCKSCFEKDLLKDILSRADYKTLIEITNNLKMIINKEKLGTIVQKDGRIIKPSLLSPPIKVEKIENSNSLLLESQIEMINKSTKRLDLTCLNKQIRKLDSSVKMVQSVILIRNTVDKQKEEPICDKLECNLCFPSSQECISQKSCLVCFSKCIYSYDKERPFKCLSCLEYSCNFCHEIVIAQNKSQLTCSNYIHNLKDSLTNCSNPSKKAVSKPMKAKRSFKRQLGEMMFQSPAVFIILRLIFIVLIINDKLNTCLCMKNAGFLKSCIKFGLLILIVISSLVYLILISIVIL